MVCHTCRPATCEFQPFYRGGGWCLDGCSKGVHGCFKRRFSNEKVFNRRHECLTRRHECFKRRSTCAIERLENGVCVQHSQSSTLAPLRLLRHLDSSTSTYIRHIQRLDKSTSTYPRLIYNVLISRLRLIPQFDSCSTERRHDKS